MPQAARVLGMTAHVTPLTSGPGSPDVIMELFPAWRALPEMMAGVVETVSRVTSGLLSRPAFTPADALPDVIAVGQVLSLAGGIASQCGAPEAQVVATSQVAALNAANATFTTTWTSASAVPGGLASATAVYTQTLKAAAEAAANSVLQAMAGLSDMDFCPAPGPGMAGGPGFVTRGSKTVIINQLPAARSGDKVMEACGGANPIVLGCPTILIDEPQPAPAAGFGAVRSSVVLNNAFTGVAMATYGPNIRIIGREEFVEATLIYLATLDATPSGHLLVESLSTAGHHTTIREAQSVQGNSAIPAGGMNDPGGWDGNGTDAEVYFYPYQTNMYNSGEDWDSLRPEVGLGHELIHADHIVHGGLPGDPTTGPMLAADPTIDEDIAFEEARTVGMDEDPMYGLPDNSGQPYSEDTIRADLGEPPRMFYNDPALGTW